MWCKPIQCAHMRRGCVSMCGCLCVCPCVCPCVCDWSVCTPLVVRHCVLQSSLAHMCTELKAVIGRRTSQSGAAHGCTSYDRRPTRGEKTLDRMRLPSSHSSQARPLIHALVHTVFMQLGPEPHLPSHSPPLPTHWTVLTYGDAQCSLHAPTQVTLRAEPRHQGPRRHRACNQ
jgi:hypothetical protein